MKLSKKQQVLEILSDYQLHHGSEFICITHRYSDVFDRLKKEDGHEIKTLPLDGRNKMAWYQLISVAVAT